MTQSQYIIKTSNFYLIELNNLSYLNTTQHFLIVCCNLQQYLNVHPKLRFLGCWGFGLYDFWDAKVLIKVPY